MNMYKVEIKNMTKTLLIWTIVMVGITSLFMSIFPSMSNSGMTEIIQAKMDAIPEGMMKAFGIEASIDFSDLLQYFAYVGQYILIGNCIYASILGVNSLIREESEGTIEFLYAQPISRPRIVTIKMLSTLTILYIFNIILFGVLVIFFELFRENGYNYFTQFLMMFKAMFIGQLVFWAIGFMVSTILPKVSLATPTTLGIFFGTYMLGIISSMVEKVEWLKYFSPVNYFMPSDILKAEGSIEISYMIISIIIIILSIGFTFYRYKTKDFKI